MCRRMHVVCVHLHICVNKLCCLNLTVEKVLLKNKLNMPMPNTAARSTRMSKKQKELFINRLEIDKFLLQQDKLKPSQLQRYNYGWSKLAEDLNKQPGARKNVKQWKDALNEFKTNTRRKARLLHEEAIGTGGGPKVLKDLGNLEERLMALLAKIVITGAANIPEGGIGEPLNETIQENVVEVLNGDSTAEVIYDFCYEDTDMGEPVQNKVVTTPLILKKRNKNSSQQRALGDIAQQHEECLKTLAASNHAVANSSLYLARAVRLKKKPVCSVFKLTF